MNGQIIAFTGQDFREANTNIDEQIKAIENKKKENTMITNGLLIIKNTILNIDEFISIQIEKDKLKLVRKNGPTYELPLNESPYELSLDKADVSATKIKLESGT